MRFAPRHLVTIHFMPAVFGNVGKALRECAIDERQNSALPQATDSSFHHSSCRGGTNKNRSRCLKKVLQPGLQASKQLFKLGTAMRYHRPQHRLQYLPPYLSRTSKEEC